jgi:hypothetical protein
VSRGGSAVHFRSTPRQRLSATDIFAAKWARSMLRDYLGHVDNPCD